ncbi:hypothetical protein [Niveispirillum sp.]|uniref:DUF7832 domain-containing protein n=1 Tax=Niveispirillum sp. TaxID=1917217 RepID=UPI001B73C8CB|nr:hypothetical protein [Niveispirillum sp.]MBP7340185.1 hypothetical protein [Niveispirillum sp.]
MTYDNASWHYEGNFPADLPENAGATHIALFLSWAVLNGLAGDLHIQEFTADLAQLRGRAVTPGEWFLSVCDGKLVDEDLNEEGNRFTHAYYAGDDGLHTGEGYYLSDYVDAFPDAETAYHVPDTWASFDTLAPILARRLAAWRKKSP